MKRDELVDNLEASCERGELVTLTLSPLPGRDPVVTGVVVALAEHYSGRGTTQCVFRTGNSVLVIGMTMILDFRVGKPPVVCATTAPGWTTPTRA